MEAKKEVNPESKSLVELISNTLGKDSAHIPAILKHVRQFVDPIETKFNELKVVIDEMTKVQQRQFELLDQRQNEIDRLTALMKKRRPRVTKDEASVALNNVLSTSYEMCENTNSLDGGAINESACIVRDYIQQLHTELDIHANGVSQRDLVEGIVPVLKEIQDGLPVEYKLTLIGRCLTKNKHGVKVAPDLVISSDEPEEALEVLRKHKEYEILEESEQA